MRSQQVVFFEKAFCYAPFLCATLLRYFTIHDNWGGSTNRLSIMFPILSSLPSHAQSGVGTLSIDEYVTSKRVCGRLDARLHRRAQSYYIRAHCSGVLSEAGACLAKEQSRRT